MSKKTKNEPRSCNQCQTQMISVALDHLSQVQSDTCIKPECPSFGLLQVPLEVLTAYLKGFKKNKKRGVK